MTPASDRDQGRSPWWIGFCAHARWDEEGCDGFVSHGRRRGFSASVHRTSLLDTHFEIGLVLGRYNIYKTGQN